MESGRDRNWLLGEPSWWRIEEGTPPDFRPGELAPPETWVSTVPSIGKFGWCRQRYRPLAWSILRPLAWAPLFLAISVVPLAIPGKTPDDQAFSAAFFLFSWILVIAPLAMARNSQPMSHSSLLSLPVDWWSLLLATAIFPLHLFVDPRIGWASYAIYWAAYIRSVQMIQISMAVPPARFLNPIDTNDWEGGLSPPWKEHSNSWRRGELASAGLGGGRFVISGISRSGQDFIAFTFVHKSGFVHDPFHESMPSGKPFSDLLNSPPPIVGIEWSEDFLNLPEEE